MQIQKFNTKEKVFIIAEIGNNHEGSYTLAEEMIGLAAEAGADAVKFQTIIPERLVSLQQQERIHQLKKFQLSYNEFGKLAKVAKNQNVIFLSTPFDIDSAIFLNDVVPAYKIASGDNDFFPLIEVIAKTGKPIIMSTGFMNQVEVKKSVMFIKNIWQENSIGQELALLHCISSYPASLESANLLLIPELEQFCDVVGYSDHTAGIEASLAAVALGAKIIEKHITINKNLPGPDHKASINPKEFSKMVRYIRNITTALGSGIKKVTQSELKNIKIVRTSIVAAREIKKGEKFSKKNLTIKRPGTGISPMKFYKIIIIFNFFHKLY